MSYTQPAPPASSWEFRTQVKHAKPAPVAPVMPVETPKPAAPIVEPAPDYATMHRAEMTCLTERHRIQRTQRRAIALCNRIAANPERMHRWGAGVMPPTMPQTTVPNGDVYR